MRRNGMIVGLAISTIGVVWILQGFNVAFAPRSFMTGNQIWAVRGGLAMVIGLLLAAWSRRRG